MKIITIFLILFFLPIALVASEKEDTIKGVVLERISQFIAYDKTHKEFKICIYGEDDLVKSFKRLYSKRKYKGAAIKIIHVSNIDEIQECDTLYAHHLDKFTIKKIVSENKKQTLLVTESIDNIYDGFMIAMYFENKKLKFAINHNAINNADLKINYRLLKIASKVINPVKGEE